MSSLNQDRGFLQRREERQERDRIESSQRMAEGSALVSVQDGIFQSSRELEIMGAVRFLCYSHTTRQRTSSAFECTLSLGRGLTQEHFGLLRFLIRRLLRANTGPLSSGIDAIVPRASQSSSTTALVSRGGRTRFEDMWTFEN